MGSYGDGNPPAQARGEIPTEGAMQQMIQRAEQ
jgi:hypothetical protein